METVLAAIVPALNEEKTIKEVILDLKKYINLIIVVSDGSIDSTEDIAISSGAIVIRNNYNKGPEYSTELGFQKAKELNATHVITFDADNQHPSEKIPEIIELMKNEKADIVVAKRSSFPRWSEYLFSYYSNYKINIKDPINGFKLIKMSVYEKIGFFDNIRGITSQILFKAYKNNFKIIEFPIDIKKRNDTPRIGKSLKANFKIICGLMRVIVDDIN
tara:strand:- start:1737 stop:2390 length:654 start_codon:yes stop_codon:yes gene_type:complete